MYFLTDKDDGKNHKIPSRIGKVQPYLQKWDGDLYDYVETELDVYTAGPEVKEQFNIPDQLYKYLNQIEIQVVNRT